MRATRAESKTAQLELLRTQKKAATLETDAEKLQRQLESMSLHYEQQRAILNAKANTLAHLPAARGAAPVRQPSLDSI